MAGIQGVPGPAPPLQRMIYSGVGIQKQPQQFPGNPIQQWHNQQQQVQQQQQQGYYPQQMPNVTRFGHSQQSNQSKQALSNMLRQGHPPNQFMGSEGQQAGPLPHSVMQRPFSRRNLRQSDPNTMQTNQAMFQQHNVQTGMNQHYLSNYGGNNMMQGGQQMIQTAQSPAMFQQQGFGQHRGSQPDYRGVPQSTPRQQYMQQASNVTVMRNMNSIRTINAGQSGPAHPYSRTTAQANFNGGSLMQPNVEIQQQQQNQFQQQQRIRQQMLALQQQQQQQQPQQQVGPQGSQQPSPVLVSHLQRQMNPNQYAHQPPHYNMG